MFRTIDATWDQSPRRRWTTLASFTMQALGLSLLLLIPPLSVQGPPRLWTRFTESPIAPPEASPQPSPPGARHGSRASELNGIHVIAPPSIPRDIARVSDIGAPAAPDFSRIGVPGATGGRRIGFFGPSAESVTIVQPPSAPAPVHPLRISHWAEGNVTYRVQPAYPILARQARIQGSVQLRAIISKAGTIENLTVLNGHAMLIKAAVEAVRQWRYHPYLLNGEPVEVETEITVNFVLAGS
jgi:protein TonB